MLIVAFLFGLIFGSFANVILLRLNTGESIIRVGSRCFSCSRKLAWFEMVPLFSFIALRAKCRSCKSKISWHYPLVEVGTGILFLLLFWKLLALRSLGEGGDFGIYLEFGIWNLEFGKIVTGLFSIFSLSTAWFLFWIASLYDLRHMILPDKLLIAAFLLGIGAFFVHYPTQSLHFSFYTFLFQLVAGAAAFLFFFILWFLSRGRWMGLGDAKFAFAMAPLFAPEELLIAIALSFFIGSILGVLLLLFGRVGWKAKIPFGPFLFLGAFVSFLWGERVLSWYMGLFL